MNMIGRLIPYSMWGIKFHFLEMPTRAEASTVLESVKTGTKKAKATALMNIGCSKATAYRVIAAAEHDGDIADKRRGNGSRPKISGPVLGGLISSFNNKTGKSLRLTARKYHVCHSTIANTLRRAGVTCKKRKKAPLYKPGQETLVQKTLGILYRDHLLSDCRAPPKIVMDDETYITANDCVKFSYSHYYARDSATTPHSIKYAPLTKYPMKVGLWYAVSDCGISDWFLWQQGLAINGEVYKLHCLQRRLIPFMEKNNLLHSGVFWPDKASAHYAVPVQRYLLSKQVRCIPKSANPTNVPQCRPIEQMHAEIKRRVFLDNFYPKTIEEFRARIDQVMKDFQKDGGNFTNGFSLRVRQLVRQAYREGVLSVHR
jgi:transposase